YVWETATGKELGRPDGYVPELDAAGKTILTTLPEGVLKVWDATTGRERCTIRDLGDVGIAAQLASDGRHVLTTVGTSAGPRILPGGTLQFPNGGSVDNIHTVDIRLWDANTGAELARLPGSTRIDRPARFSPDGKTIVYTRLGP